MKPSNDLYSLVHSLNAAEKSYIKKYASIYSKNKYNYYKLLEAIYKQETYDEKALLIKLRKEPFIRHFAVTKNQLFDLILKLLRQFHQNNSFHASINSLIENGQLLYERGLSDLGLKQLNKAYKLAKEHSAYVKLEEIIDLKRHYIGQLKGYDWREEIKALLQEKARLSKAESEHVLYADLYYKLLFFLRQNFHIRDEKKAQELEEIIPNGILAVPQHSTHFYSQLHYLNIQNMYFFLKREFTKSTALLKEIIHLWEQFPKLMQRETERYIAALNNYMTNAYMDKQWDAIDYVLPKIERIDQKTTRLQAIVFENVTLWKINYYTVTNQYNKYYQMLPEMEISLKRLKNTINEARYFIIMRQIAYSYFTLGKYNQALDYLEIVLELKQLALREDLQMFSNFLFFFIHYHLDNVIFLDNALKNYRRKINKKSLLYDLENFQLRLLSKLCAAPNRTVLLKIINDFQKELSLLTEKNPIIKDIQNQHLNLNLWMESIKQNCTIKLILEKNSQIL